jgi:hypothetical protein
MTAQQKKDADALAMKTKQAAKAVADAAKK